MEFQSFRVSGFRFRFQGFKISRWLSGLMGFWGFRAKMAKVNKVSGSVCGFKQVLGFTRFAGFTGLRVLVLGRRGV